MSSQSQQVPESADDDSHLSRSVGGRESLQVPQDLPGKDLYAMLSSASTSGSHDGSGLSNSVPGKLSFAALRQRRNKVIVHGENESTGSSSADRYSSQSPLAQQKHYKQSSQPAEKKTEHIIVETTAGLYFIVSKLSTRKDVQLISIEPKLGTLKYKHRPQEDLFDTLEEALSHIEVTLELTIKTKTTACALLGYVVLENMGCLLVATKVTTDGEFFWGHNVCTVSESSWIKIPLTYPAPQNTNEIANFETLSEFQLDGLHYYCETYDMTRPFPSFRDPWDCATEFSWNEWLSEPFSKVGLRAWCPVLLQGTCRYKYVPEAGATLSLITRKSNGNPGTRFNARGINDAGAPGNEIECDLVLWTKPAGGVSRWCSHVWRRGTVPLWWSSAAPKGMGDPTITVRSRNPYEGCEKYVSSLSGKFGQPLCFVNLLREDSTKGEAQLSEHFQQAIQYTKHFISVDATVMNYDWHMKFKDDRSGKAVDGLWDMVRDYFGRIDLTEGSAALEKGCAAGMHDRVFTVDSKQNGVFRVNCADSLDRTNVATFFLCLQILTEMARRLGAPIFAEGQRARRDTGTTTTTTSTTISSGGSSNNRAEKWQGLALKCKELIGVMEQTKLVATLADFFIYSGDVFSVLYTNSLAAHSGPIRELSSNPSATPSNTLISIQRRYHNVMHDQGRQAQYEMFLGLRRKMYFPSFDRPRLEIVSDFPAHAIPYGVVPQQDQSAVLLSDKAYCVSDSENKIDITFMLSSPTEIKEIMLTLGASKNYGLPHTIDLWIGMYMNNLKIVYHDLALPEVSTKTQIMFHVPPSLWDIYNADYDPSIGSSYVSRFVRLVAHGSHSNGQKPFALGKVEVYGYTPKAKVTPVHDRNSLRMAQVEEKACALASLLENASEVEPDGKQRKMEEALNACLFRTSNGSCPPEGANAPKNAERMDEYNKKVQVALNNGRIKFSEVLGLELDRLAMGVTPAERDEVLTQLDLADKLCPYNYQHPRDEKFEEALAQSTSAKAPACPCGTTFGFFSRGAFICSYCREKTCSDCLSKSFFPIPEFCWDSPHKVCVRCAEEILKQQDDIARIDEIRTRKTQLNPFQHIMQKVQGAQSGVFCTEEYTRLKPLVFCISEYPAAGFIDSVPCGEDSAPAEVLLMPEDIISYTSARWIAPHGTRSVSLNLALPCESLITSVGIIADQQGYTHEDRPLLNVRVMETLTVEKASFDWDTFSESDNSCGTPKCAKGWVEGGTMISYSLEESTHGCVIFIRVSLPEEAGPSARIHIGKIIITGKPLLTAKSLGNFNHLLPPASPQPQDDKLSSSLTESPERCATQPPQTPILFPSPKKSFYTITYATKSSSKGKGWIDIGLGNSKLPVHGFVLSVEHGEEGITSQVRALRVSLINCSSHNVPERRMELGKFVIPKCKHGTLLTYEFEWQSEGNALRFSYNTNYGSKTATSVGKLAIF